MFFSVDFFFIFFFFNQILHALSDYLLLTYTFRLQSYFNLEYYPIYVWRPVKETSANSADPDQMPQMWHLIRTYTVCHDCWTFFFR